MPDIDVNPGSFRRNQLRNERICRCSFSLYKAHGRSNAQTCEPVRVMQKSIGHRLDRSGDIFGQEANLVRIVALVSVGA